MRTIANELRRLGLTKELEKEQVQKKSKEIFSAAELRELMGCNRSRYTRSKGGAYKQR